MPNPGPKAKEAKKVQKRQKAKKNHKGHKGKKNVHIWTVADRTKDIQAEVM